MAKTQGQKVVEQFLQALQDAGYVDEVVHVADSWCLQSQRDGQKGLRWVVRTLKSGVYLGAQINKGLDRSALGYSPATKLVMNDTWLWMTTMPELIDRIEDWPDAEVHLKLANGMEPGFVPDTSDYRHEFTWKVQQGRLALVRPVYDASAAGAIAEESTLASVIEHLGSLPEYRWLWARLEWGHQVGTEASSIEAAIHDVITRFGAVRSNQFSGRA